MFPGDHSGDDSALHSLSIPFRMFLEYLDKIEKGKDFFQFLLGCFGMRKVDLKGFS